MHAVSTDGEATVYLTSDFSGDFDVSYDVQFPPSPGNRSWTFVSVLLLGRSAASGSVSVGLSRGAPRDTTLSAFTSAAQPKASPVYRNIPVNCKAECTIELRGDATTISALVDRRFVGTWSRKDLALSKPYVQINGEVTGLGDRISARLISVRSKAGNKVLPAPTCAFTTQGIRAYAMRDGLWLTGRRDPRADATYISLPAGTTGDTCRDAHVKSRST